MDKKTGHKTLYIASLLAVIVSIILIYQHYNPEESKFCNFGASFSCDIVNKGEYSTIDGEINLLLSMIFGGYYSLYLPIPNSIISFFIMLFIMGAAKRLYKNKKYFGMGEKKLIKLIKLLLVLSALYALFLVYIEAAIIQSWCIFCLALDALILIMLITVFSIRR